MISDAIKGDLKKDNWEKYVGAGAQGAIIGGVAGLTAGVGLGVVATVGLGMGAGAVGNTANQVIRNGGFNNFKAKELVVSSIASGAGFGVGKVVSSATSNLSSNIATQVKQNITAKVAQKTIQGTVQGAIVGGSAGSAGGFAANTTDQVFDLAIGEKDNFDFGSLAKDTFIGGLTGTVAGAGFGFAGSKFSDTKFGVKVSQLDNKYNAAIKNNATKFIDATKNTFSKMLVDETGSVRLGAKGNASGGVKGSVKTGNRFPENPDDLLPDISRPIKVKGNGSVSQEIITSDNLRIRAETHPLEPGETFNPRHHGQHYHVEKRLDPTKSWNNKNNVQKVYPPNYTPGTGTGFLPGEEFPK